MLKIITLICTMLCIIPNMESAKILQVFDYHSKSHYILGNILLKALAERGHEVTMISFFHENTTLNNCEYLLLSDIMDWNFTQMKNDVLLTIQNLTTLQNIELSYEHMYKIINIIYDHKSIKKLLSSETKYDLVVQNWLFNPASLAIASHFKVPVVLLGSFGSINEIDDFVGNPNPYSYVPFGYSVLSTKMTFWERLKNTMINLVSEYRIKFVYFPKQEALVAKHFPNAPSMHQLVNSISTVALLNTHFSIENSRPYVPSMISIGGFHIQKAQKIDNDIEAQLDSATEGVIYFSLGSNLKLNMFNKQKLLGITNCLSKLPYTILLKSDDEGLPETSSNVIVRKWFPQTAILSHPNVKLFITHGGILSLTEAIYHGVPILGIPFYGDQFRNVAFSVTNGYGVKLLYPDLHEESLTDGIHEVLNNCIYQENVRRRSQHLRDQPLKPLDNAIFWIEYVLSRKEAGNLKSNAVGMPWYQYHMIDVGLALICLLTIMLLIVKRVLVVIGNRLIKILLDFSNGID